MTNKNIFITGAAGMIGSNLVDKLIKDKKNKIYAVDNFILGKKKFIKKFINNKNFFFKEIDLAKKINFKFLKGKKKLNEVWLLAANSNILNGIKDSRIDLNNTFMTTFNTLIGLQPYINKKTKIMFSSSSAVFGDKQICINEESIFQPVSNYGAMKLLSESFINYFCNKYSLKSYIFRFPNVVGENLTHGIVYDFFKKKNNKQKIFQVLGNGYQKKPYSYCDEIIDCMFFLVKKKIQGNIDYFNLGTNDKGIEVKEIVNIFKSKTGLKKIIKYQNTKRGWPGDVARYYYSTNKINKYGYKFKMSSEEAIIKAIEKNLHKFK